MKTFRLILGYLMGFSAFVLLIPYLLVIGSQNHQQFLNLSFIRDFYIRLIIAVPVFCIGLLFAVWSNVFLLDKGEGGPVEAFNVAISPRSKKLVVTGPYRYCRNPMVFGTICLYTSISVYLNSLFDLLIVLSFVPLMILFLKLSEEKRLIKDFGHEYLLYRAKTPMILPFTKCRKQSKKKC